MNRAPAAKPSTSVTRSATESGAAASGTMKRIFVDLVFSATKTMASTTRRIAPTCLGVICRLNPLFFGVRAMASAYPNRDRAGQGPRPYGAGPMPVSPSPYLTLQRDEWARLAQGTPLTLSEADVETLRSFNEPVSPDEVADVYLPLSRLLDVHVAAARDLRHAVGRFLDRPVPAVPYVIGIAGSVAVGKSTTARILQALLAGGPDPAQVDLVTTDGFLFPNAVLAERGLLHRKGFPESYDVRRLVNFMADLKAGVPEVAAPVYSHLAYDVVDGDVQVLDRPGVVIVEGVNVLQAPVTAVGAPARFVSDYFDFSIYVDARADDIASWYVQRFLALRRTAFADPASFFHRFSTLSDDQAVATATDLWTRVNEVNRRENIEPTRSRALLILEKGRDHAVQSVHLRLS